MKGPELKAERYFDVEELLCDSFSDKSYSEENEDLVLEYLCQTISRQDSYDTVKKRAEHGDHYANIMLASWHISHAENIKDYCLAYDYSLKAVKYQYIEGYYILGQLAYYGVGCEKNLYRAEKYFKRFVEGINPKQLLNETVLSDSYLKLIDIKKKQGKYRKAKEYANKLCVLFHEYQSIEQDLCNEMKQKKNEFIIQTIYVFTLILSICCAAFYVFNCSKMISNSYVGKYDIPDKIIRVEERQTESQVPSF